jgi:hypothetical protein
MKDERYNSKEFLETLSDIITKYAVNVKSNTEYEIHMRCPICGDSKKSLQKARGCYYKKTGTYYCFNCNEFMPGLQFASLISGLDEKVILSDFNRSYLDQMIVGMGLAKNSEFKKERFNINPQAIVYPNTRSLNDNEISYLKKRRIYDLPFFEQLDINGITAKQGDFIFIPWIFNKKLLNYQIHNYNKYKKIPKYLFSKHGIKPIYGLNRIDESFKKLIIFEGVFDSLFVKNGIAIGGKTLTEFQQVIIDSEYSDYEIILAFDHDSSGMSAMSKIFKQNGKTNYKFFMPDFGLCKDLNEYSIKSKVDLNYLLSEEFIEKNTISGIELISKMYNL